MNYYYNNPVNLIFSISSKARVTAESTSLGDMNSFTSGSLASFLAKFCSNGFDFFIF